MQADGDGVRGGAASVAILGDLKLCHEGCISSDFFVMTEAVLSSIVALGSAKSCLLSLADNRAFTHGLYFAVSVTNFNVHGRSIETRARDRELLAT